MVLLHVILSLLKQTNSTNLATLVLRKNTNALEGIFSADFKAAEESQLSRKNNKRHYSGKFKLRYFDNF